MRLEAFTDAWAREWFKKLNESQAYRSAAAYWEGAVVLVMEADPSRGIASARAIFADLWRGGCRGARAATGEDLSVAAYIFSADLLTWQQVLNKEIEPFQALTRGRIRLTRGSLTTLASFVGAAAELVATAARLDTAYPEAIA